MTIRNRWQLWIEMAGVALLRRYVLVLEAMIPEGSDVQTLRKWSGVEALMEDR